MTKPERSFIDLDSVGSFDPILSRPLLDSKRGRWVFADGMELPVFAGGADNPVAYPLGPPTVSGTTVTVDTMQKQPTRVTRFIMDITQEKFILDRLMASPGGVTGGAVIYDQATENELYTQRDVESVRPGKEFPVVTSERQQPRVAEVDKHGGKIFLTIEARDRNDQTALQNELRKLGNTIVRKNNEYAVSVLNAAITEHNRTMPGNDWSTLILEGNNPTAPADRPTADFATANVEALRKQLGVNFNTLILAPEDEANLIIGYGEKLDAVLKSLGITSRFSSVQMDAGEAILAAEKQVGEFRLEQPLMTESWYEEETQRFWWQSSVRPVAYVTNPFSMIKLTGLQGA